MALTTRPKRTVHHKKTKGEHHRQGKHYLKAYSPYLPLLLIVIVGLAINSFWSSRLSVLGVSTNLSSNSLLESTNTERTQKQVRELKLNQSLSMAAQEKAQDMVDQNYWSHVGPDGRTPWSFIRASGYQYQAAAENLAYGFNNSPTTIAGWMQSDEHRKNLLNDAYHEVGFGIATADNFVGYGKTTVIVAMYGTPVGQSQASGTAGTSMVAGETPLPPMKTVSRIHMLTGGSAPWSFMLVSIMTMFALLLFMYRHARIWHRILVKSEIFVIHHKLLDVVTVSFSVVGYVLTRAAGYI